MPAQTREAALLPLTYRAADNSMDVCWTTGIRRRAYDWFNDQVYDEELEVSRSAVDMTRFEAGTVQVIDSHRTQDGIDAILGVATRGWIENGEGMARIAFSKDPAKAGKVGDIVGGIIRAMSFGYSVQKYEVTLPKARTDGGTVPLYRAVMWTPLEITFCPVGADGKASPRAEEVEHTRSQPALGAPCEFVIRAEVAHPLKAKTMTDVELQAQRDADAAAAAAVATRAAADAAASILAERTRCAEITKLCTTHGVDATRAAKFISENVSLDVVRAEILEARAEADKAAGGATRNISPSIRTVTDETQTRLEGLEEAILSRVDAKHKISDNGKQYRSLSLLEMGRLHLERSNRAVMGMTRMQVASEMMMFRSGGSMTTSDFASLLQNVATKRLRNAYDENMPSFRMWAREAPDAPDFKSMSVVNLAGAPDLLQVNEHGEFTYGSMTDGKETYSLITYGRIVSMTRQLIINDDLRGFDRIVGAFGNSSARLENRTAYAILTANANLADGGALFNATAVTTAGGHANLTSSGTAIDAASLAIGRTAMRRQKGLQSEELNIAPKYLIVPATKEQLAYQYTSSNYVPATQANTNEFRTGGRTALEPVVEAVLDATSTTAWYLAADNSQVDTVEFCHLQGANGPVIESEMGFEIDGISFKCRLDFAAKAIDFRGLYKNVGA